MTEGGEGMSEMKPGSPSVTNLDDVKLVALIRQAEHRLLVMAPGVSKSVAAALGEAWQRLGADAVMATEQGHTSSTLQHIVSKIIELRHQSTEPL